MSILDGLVIPLPTANLELLNYLLILGMLVFLTYSGVLLGSMLLSVLYKFRATDDLNDKNNVLSKEFSDVATNSLTNAWGLGLVPFIAIIFIYAQLLHKIEVGVVNYLIVAFLLYGAGLFLIYRYKNSIHISTTLQFINKRIDRDSDDEEIQVFDEFAKTNEVAKKSSGMWGILFLVSSLWIFLGSSSLAVDSQSWGQTGNVLWLFISLDAIIKTVQFLTVSVAIASITYLFLHFYWQKKDYKHSKPYVEFSRRVNVTVAILFALTQPFFFVVSLINTPQQALNNSIFIASLIGVIAVFVLVHYLYAMLKQKINYSHYAFVAIIIVVAAMVTKEKTAFGTINKHHIAVLNQDYIQHEQEYMASLGRGQIEVDAADLYNRCKACHQAEDTPAAPAHKNVVPKYAGKKQELVAYILNPVKVDPKYPLMPAQGLKPHEAEAVAEFMLEKFTDAGGGENPTANKDEGSSPDKSGAKDSMNKENTENKEAQQ